MNKNSRRRCAYPPSRAPGISGTKAIVIFVFGEFKNPQKVIFALAYTKMNKNSRRRCAYPPSWAPGNSGTEADVIFVFGDLKKTQK